MDQKYMELLKNAEAWVDAHRDEYIEELKGFVRFPSVSRADLAEPGAPFGPECRKVLDYAMERGRFYNFDVMDHDGCAVSITMGDPVNSIGAIAHMDVVPVGDGWIYPPFDPTYLPEYDAMIGRGVGDNKGPGVASLFAMRLLRDLKWPLKHGLRLMCGSSEETGMQDMKLLLDKGLQFPKVSLVPDAAFPVNYAQKGSVDAELSIPCEGNLVSFDAGSVRNIIPDLAECVITADLDTVNAALAALDPELTAKLTVTACEQGVKVSAAGQAGHAASPARSVNAIMLLTAALSRTNLLTGTCAKAIAELADLTADGFGQSEGVAYSDEISGELTLVYGVAHQKDGQLIVSVDCRFPVTCKAAELAAKMQAHWISRGFSVVRLSTSDPFYIPKDDPRVLALQDLFHEVTGRDDQPYTMGGGTYSRVVPNAISFGPSVMGERPAWDFLPPGHGSAHGRDEIVAMSSLRTCTVIYAVAFAMLDALEN